MVSFLLGVAATLIRCIFLILKKDAIEEVLI